MSPQLDKSLMRNLRLPKATKAAREGPHQSPCSSEVPLVLETQLCTFLPSISFSKQTEPFSKSHLNISLT